MEDEEDDEDEKEEERGCELPVVVPLVERSSVFDSERQRKAEGEARAR